MSVAKGLREPKTWLPCCFECARVVEDKNGHMRPTNPDAPNNRAKYRAQVSTYLSSSPKLFELRMQPECRCVLRVPWDFPRRCSSSLYAVPTSAGLWYSSRHPHPEPPARHTNAHQQAGIVSLLLLAGILSRGSSWGSPPGGRDGRRRRGARGGGVRPRGARNFGHEGGGRGGRFRGVPAARPVRVVC